MNPMERVQLVASSIMLAGWGAMVVDAWPMLAARLSPLTWFSVVTMHGAALLVAGHIYLRSRKPPPLAGREVLALVSIWMMTWIVDFSLFSKLRD